MTDQNLATIYDEASPAGKAGNGAAAPDASAIRAAAKEVKTNVANFADHAALKAKEAYRQSKVMAGQRAEQAVGDAHDGSRADCRPALAEHDGDRCDRIAGDSGPGGLAARVGTFAAALRRAAAAGAPDG